MLRNAPSSLILPENPSRRRFVAGLAASLAGAAMLPAWGSVAAAAKPRELSLYHLHTGEKLKVEYYDGANYLTDALSQVNTYLRDFRTGEVHAIDPHLLDALHDLQANLSRTGTFEIISGYRSPATNAALRKKSKRVARRSLHMQGKAMDVRLAGVDTLKLRKAAMDLHRGGVGYYAKSNFVHIDTGRVRYW
ncbi:MAG: DUF882 domain-containing protein [Pseudomonadota bacterium]|nr:DUF882 domain-containing protein [Pseudomonadota bacterium]